VFVKSRRPIVALLLFVLMVLGPRAGSALTTDQQQVTRVTVSAVQARFPNAKRTPRVVRMAIVGKYALTTWLLGEGGGQAVLHKDSKAEWSALAVHGGVMDTTILVAFGVPSATATKLEANLAPLPRQTP
jgi:hypothetical protein